MIEVLKLFLRRKENKGITQGPLPLFHITSYKEKFTVYRPEMNLGQKTVVKLILSTLSKVAGGWGKGHRIYSQSVS